MSSYSSQYQCWSNMLGFLGRQIYGNDMKSYLYIYIDKDIFITTSYAVV